MSDITLVCRRPGMRRNGKAHADQANYALEDWTEEQWEIFEKDPDFIVVKNGEGSEDETTGDSSSSRPEGDALTLAIMDAVEKLEEGTKPTVAVIKSALGFDISGKELGAALKEMKSK